MPAPIVFRDGRYNGRTAREWLPDVVAALVAEADPLKIVLFGSVAAGTEARDSDLDLLVVLPHVEDKIEAMLQLRRAVAHVPVPLDIIPTDPDDLALHKDDPGSLLGPAMRLGRVVHERAACAGGPRQPLVALCHRGSRDRTASRR